MPRKPSWKPSPNANMRDQMLRSKYAEALLWQSGPNAWTATVCVSAPTEAEAKALAEKLVQEAKP